MTKVYLAELGDPTLDAPVRKFRQFAADDQRGIHSLVDGPEQADMVLWTQCHMLGKDWRLEAITEHPVTKRYREKTLVYDERDKPWCALPGVYVSMPRRFFNPVFQRAWSYYSVPAVPSAPERDLLFSFVASPSHPCRVPLFSLQHPNAVVEEARNFTFFDPSSPGYDQQRDRFTNVLGRSRFVLCTRGKGTSAGRFYEAMSAGAVPVIIADDWVAPSGVPWESFSIRWPENQLEGLVEMLQREDADWEHYHHEVRSAFDKYFASHAAFHSVVEQAKSLLPLTGIFPESGLRDGGYMTAGWDVLRRSGPSSARSAIKVALRRIDDIRQKVS